jgi:hypothetical protein
MHDNEWWQIPLGFFFVILLGGGSAFVFVIKIAQWVLG